MERRPRRFLRSLVLAVPVLAVIALCAEVRSLRTDPSHSPTPPGTPAVVESGRDLLPFSDHLIAPSVAFAPDGRAVVAGGNRGVVRWDLEPSANA
jgi:hypothetical protein